MIPPVIPGGNQSAKRFHSRPASDAEQQRSVTSPPKAAVFIAAWDQPLRFRPAIWIGELLVVLGHFWVEFTALVQIPKGLCRLALCCVNPGPLSIPVGVL